MLSYSFMMVGDKCMLQVFLFIKYLPKIHIIMIKLISSFYRK